MCRKLFFLLFIVLVLGLVENSANGDLAAYYALDGDAGDSSGNGNNGSEQGGPTYVAGKFGQAISLNGSGDYVDCGNDSSLNPTDAITVAAWIYPTSYGTSSAEVVAKLNTQNNQRAYVLRLDTSTHKLHMFISPDGTNEAGNAVNAISNSSIPLNEWTHVAGVYNGSTIKVYVNGNEDGSEPYSSGINSSTAPVYIGALLISDSPARYFDGRIDEVGIYNGILLESEIEDIATNGVRNFTPERAYNPNPANGELLAGLTTVLSWSPGDDATSHDVYFGTDFDDVNHACRLLGDVDGSGQVNWVDMLVVVGWWLMDPQGSDPYAGLNDDDNVNFVDFAILADNWMKYADAVFKGNQTDTTFDTGTMDANETYYWRIDERNANNTRTGEVWMFTTESNDPPGQVTNPDPNNGATQVATNSNLSWTAGTWATSHDVYFGTTSPGTFQANQYGTIFDTNMMEPNTTYYWRVDEKNAFGTTAGTLWSFTTGTSSISGVAVEHLRCEYRLNPLGIDVTVPRLSWVLKSNRRGQKQNAYRILVASSESNLSQNNGDLWDSGQVSSGQSTHIEYNGTELKSRMRCYWKVCIWDKDNKTAWSKPAFWTMGLLKNGDWQGKWIGYDVGSTPPDEDGLVLPKPPYMRNEFTVSKTVEKATLYAAAIGLDEIHINAKRVGDSYFTPGWTDYFKRRHYHTYDVTDMIDSGDNAIGIILGDGWYAGYLGWNKQRELYGSTPRALVQLEIEYTDDSNQVVVTDSSWKAAYGPHIEADILMGEEYDARNEMPGWDTNNFDEAGWNSVAYGDVDASLLKAYPSVPIRKIKQFRPLSVSEPQTGKYIFNMGQNFAGWVRLRVDNANSGDKIVLRFGEKLNSNGTLFTGNLRDARAQDTYICKGGGTEVWEPSFTYHGFQYVEVSGYPGTPTLDDINGIAISSDTPVTGSFECSNELVNKIYSNVYWSQRSNFIEIPTDCPQRDERLGWTGDAQFYARTSTCNTDVSAFFTKWMADLMDAQSPNGAFPDVAPRKVFGGEGVSGWGDAGIICTWVIYKIYGDTRIIENCYDAMEDWMDYLDAHSTNYLRPDEGYGDWLNVNDGTSKDVFGTAYYAHSAEMMAEMAEATGKTSDATAYNTLFENIKNAFNNEYVNAGAVIKGNTQTAYCLALYFDLLPQNKRGDATDNLMACIEARNGHLSTGFAGTGYLLPALTQNGKLDTAYSLLLKQTYPSWGYWLNQGATTMLERWNGWSGQDSMNSFNHYSFATVGLWLFSTVAGIDVNEPGYKQITIKPQPGGGITYVKSTYESIHGEIATYWNIDANDLTLDITIPPNTTATVYIPAHNADNVKESGTAASQANGVEYIKMEDGSAVFDVDSGTYYFISEGAY